MTYSIDQGQINAAAKGDLTMQQTLSSFKLAIDGLYQNTGSGPLKKVDATTPKNLAAPPQCKLSVVGNNGTWVATITLPQQASGSSKPKNSTNATIYHEISSSTSPNFSTGVTVYPLTAATTVNIPAPGSSETFRLRSTYDQVTFNNYSVVPGVVAAGLQTSAATEPNNSLNQSNFATIDSIGAGGSATVRIYGSGGPGTSWTSVLGANSKVIPAGTIINVTYGVTGYVAWNGSSYEFKAGLTQTFPDNWIPVGKVSVIGSGSGLVLPVVHLVLGSGGAVLAWNVTSGGANLTADVTLAIVTSTGSGATPGAQIISGGVLQSISPGNPGANYAGGDTVTVGGGVAAGVGGGGGPNGINTGRLYGNTT